MTRENLTAVELRRELDDVKSRYPRLDVREIFIAWFLRAYVTADEKAAISALCGGSNDKDVDAVLIDDSSRKAFIVQGKYRLNLMKHSEKRPDVRSFAELGPDVTGGNEEFKGLSQKMSPDVFERLLRVREKALRGKYAVQLFYVTTGRASKALQEEARKIARSGDVDCYFDFFDGNRVLGVLDYYLRDVAPPVASLDLEMESGNGVEIKGVFHRFDGRLNIESWVFAMTGRAVAQMYKEAGQRLFALNIRGYLGDAEINKGMEETLEDSPGYFWYYNNGLTIVCDEAKQITSGGRDILRISNPQVINGQQTTRILAKEIGHNAKASVTVRVIRVPHTMDTNSDHFDELVSQIVKSTNWQNYIVPSDLISNDRRQIEIHRQLRNLGYWYVRKRQTKGEARREAGSKQYHVILKTELAQAVAGCDLDPSIVRRGKEKLFDKDMYGTVFPKSEPYYYLKRFWLKREVEIASRGYPERAYAKWLVLHFVWERVSHLLEGTSRRNAFEREWKANRGNALDRLYKVNSIIFQAVLQFYRHKRGKGAKAIDVSTFFQRINLDHEFDTFWGGPRNGNRDRFAQALKRFDAALAKAAEE